MNERVLNTHSKGERVKIPLLLKQSKIKGAGQRQWSRQWSRQCDNKIRARKAERDAQGRISFAISVIERAYFTDISIFLRKMLYNLILYITYTRLTGHISLHKSEHISLHKSEQA